MLQAIRFSDQGGTTASVPSTWRDRKVAVAATEMQTDPIGLQHQETQVVARASVEAQTDPTVTSARSSRGRLFDVGPLTEFLQRVERPLADMLMENLQTTAFSEWSLDWGTDGVDGTERSQPLLQVSDTDLLVDPDVVDPDMTLVAMDKSQSGNSLVLGYAIPHRVTRAADTWCTHASRLSMWQAGKPTASTTLTSCVTTVAIHPDTSAWVAAGTWLGTVLLWDTGSTTAATSAASAVAHQDAVTAVRWCGPMVWSIALDGALIEWRRARDELEAVRHLVVAIPRTQLGCGLVSMAMHPDPVSSVVVLATEVGQVIHMDARRMKAVGKAAAQGSVATAPHFRYAGHVGVVPGLAFNAFVPMCVSVGDDGKLALYRVFRDTPIHLVPTATPLLAVAWSPLRPAVLAVTTATSLSVYDFAANLVQPVATLALNCTGPVFFHPTLPIIYVGALAGGKSGVQTVRLSSGLVTRDIGVRRRDVAALAKLMGTADEDEHWDE
ncbi:WD repeat-containing protein 34 [Allomyces javanicus]|nr:WD repeat-containing protein 34 [Allomyces javanicus]